MKWCGASSLPAANRSGRRNIRRAELSAALPPGIPARAAHLWLPGEGFARFGVGGILSCFDAANGALLWRKQSTNDYLGASTKSDSSMSPIVVDGRCIVHVGDGTNGAIIAFELAGGEPRWKWDGDGPANSSPVLMTVGGKKQLSPSRPRSWSVLTWPTGKLLWQAAIRGRSGEQHHARYRWLDGYLHRPGQRVVRHENRAAG